MTPHPVAGRAAPVPTVIHGPPLLERLRRAARARGDSQPTADTLVSWARAFILFHLGELPHPRPPRLLDQLRLVLRVRHYAPSTEDCYVQWARRFILFHRKRHPRTMGAAEVEQFLTHLAVEGHISASSQNQALNALVFLYVQVLDIDLGRFDAVRARRGKRLPVVLTPEEVRLVLGHVLGADGLFRLMARLLYGCGLRVSECCSLRVHDLDLGRAQIMVRGDRNRALNHRQSQVTASLTRRNRPNAGLKRSLRSLLQPPHRVGNVSRAVLRSAVADRSCAQEPTLSRG